MVMVPRVHGYADLVFKADDFRLNFSALTGFSFCANRLGVRSYGQLTYIRHSTSKDRLFDKSWISYCVERSCW